MQLMSSLVASSIHSPLRSFPIAPFETDSEAAECCAPLSIPHPPIPSYFKQTVSCRDHATESQLDVERMTISTFLLQDDVLILPVRLSRNIFTFYCTDVVSSRLQSYDVSEIE